MKSRFIQLFELSPEAMVIVDRTGQIHQANKQAEELFGYGRDQLRGESVHTLFPGQPIALPGSQGPAENLGRHLQLVGSSSDLRQFPADVNVIPLQTERGAENVVSIRDLTEEQRAQFVLELGLDAQELANRDRRAASPPAFMTTPSRYWRRRICDCNSLRTGCTTLRNWT